MACILTINQPKDCRDNVGGLRRAWIGKLTDFDLSATTFDGACAITLLVVSAAPSSATPLYQYDFNTQSGLFESTLTPDRVAGTNFWTHVVTFPLAKKIMEKSL